MSVLNIRGLEAHHGLLKAVRGVNFELKEGERLALVGANGAGKTTLLRTLAGAHRASHGSIEFDGTDVTNVPAHQRAALGIALVPEGRRLFGSLSVAENLQVALSAKRKGPWHLDSVLEAFPILKPKLKAAAASLSGGQQQAVAIGRALMTNPRLLLLDEVSLGLSPAAVQGVYESLASVVAQRTTLILVEQDLQRTFDFAERIVCMLEGAAVAVGTTSEMTRDEVMAHYFGHRVSDKPKEPA